MTYQRDLGSTESFFWRENIVFTNTFIVNSQIDFNNQKDLVLKSVSKWKNENPILRCRISTHSNRNDENSSEYFYEIADELLIRNNVLFLQFKNNSDKDLQSEALKLMSQSESLGEFIGQNNLLWRLLFIR